MVDAISLVIGASFGGFILLLILGFYLLERRNRNVADSSSPFGNRDYSQYAPRRQAQESKYSYDRRPFRSDAEIEANARRARSNARTIVLVIIVLAIAAVIVAGIFEPIELILLVFLIPIAISFLRPRRDRSNDRDRERRY